MCVCKTSVSRYGTVCSTVRRSTGTDRQVDCLSPNDFANTNINIVGATSISGA